MTTAALPYRSRIAAAVLAIFTGTLGLHRFYLGQWWGVFYLLFCWTLVPTLISFVEGLIFLGMSSAQWNIKYHKGRIPVQEPGSLMVILILSLPVLLLPLASMSASMLLLLIKSATLATVTSAQSEQSMRERIDDAYHASSVIQLAVADYVKLHQQWPASIRDMDIQGLQDTPYIAGVEIRDGEIRVRLAAAAGISGTLVYVPIDAGLSEGWVCKSATIPKKLLPSECN